MGSEQSTTSRVTLEAANAITQTSVASCEVTCNQDQSNGTVIISPGANVGNISFTQSCVIDDATCTINQNINSAVENILNATVDQKSMSTKSLFSFTYNSSKVVSDMDQLINNQIRQTINSSCTFETNQTMNNNYVYVGANSEVGNITFAQHAELSNVECTMDATAKSTSYNEETSTVEQKNTTINMLVMLFLIFAIVICMAFVVIIVFLLSGGTEAITEAAKGYEKQSGGLPPIIV